MTADQPAPGPTPRRLVLTSRRVPADLRAHARGARAVVISNAADCYGRAGRAAKVARDVSGLTGAGFTTTTLDLRSHHHTRPAALADRLADADLIWVGGGATFWLVHQLHRSGFAAQIAGLLDAGVTYAGESAGALAAGPSLRGVERADDASLSPDPSQPGLGLVPFLAWAHWNPRHPEHPTRHAALPGATTPMYRLRDGEYLLVTCPRAGAPHVELRANTPPKPTAAPAADLPLW